MPRPPRSRRSSRTRGSRRAPLLLPPLLCAVATIAATAPPILAATGATLASLGGGGAAAPAVPAAEIRAHVDFLASDALEGRDSGHRGAEIAARYIASHFEALGLSPLLDTWEMPFDLAGPSGKGAARLELGGNEISGESVLAVPSWSATGRVEGALSEGDAPANGAIAILDDSFPNPRAARRAAGDLAAKGAAAVVLVEPEEILTASAPRADFRRMGGEAPGGDDAMGKGLMQSLEDLPDDIRSMIEEELASRGIDPSVLDSGNAEVHVEVGSPEGEEESEGESAEELERGRPGGVAASQRRGQRVRRPRIPVVRASSAVGRELRDLASRGGTARLEVTREGAARSANVLARIEGSDPALRDEIVLLGAHYDHVGKDDQGNIWNGADDNASGTSGVLGIATALAQRRPAPRRTIVLAAWGAEERGLVGSRAFAANPPVPLDHIVACINLDMISRNDPGSILVIHASDDLAALAREKAPAHGLEAEDGPAFFLQQSDAGSFSRHDIPTLFLFSGLHEDYHQASDDPDTIDADKAARVASTALDVALAVADADGRPGFTKPPASFPGGGGPGRRMLGIMPDFAAQGEGAAVAEVLEGTVAEEAGIEAGDHIVRLGNHAVGGLRDLRRAIRELPAKETFEIEVVRGGAPVVLQGTFPE